MSRNNHANHPNVLDQLPTGVKTRESVVTQTHG